MMKSTDFGTFNHRTKLGRLNGSRLRGIFAQRQVSARTQVIIEIRFENSPQGPLVEDHHMVPGTRAVWNLPVARRKDSAKAISGPSELPLYPSLELFHERNLHRSNRGHAADSG